MIEEVKWNNFKAKFNGREQAAFERLCYLLFCKEYNKDLGIFRFKNHAGIETNPVEKDGKVVGWQAKFYDTRLSEHKDDFIQSIDTTNTRHPEANKIIFYTNQDFGQDKKKTDPQYKTKIEDHAKGKGIEIEWRTGSYFESSFVREQNFSIAQHFFSLKKGILDSITELALYTESILKAIRTAIAYDGKTIKLDRSQITKDISDVADGGLPVILSGGVGVGKTAIIKDFYEAIKDRSPLFVFKATQFRNITHINQLFKDYGEITATDFINEHKDIKTKFIVIDSAERLAEIEDQDVFRMFLSSLVENGWAVIFTVRYSYLDDLRFQLKEVYGIGFTSLNIPDLTREEVEKIATNNGFKLPKNERLVALLGTPLYLNEYLQNYASVGENASYGDFREIIWKKQIQDSTKQSGNIHRCREDCFLKIARKRADDGGFFVKTEDCDQEALQKLEADEIIKFDSNAGGYFITHDVYEEWALDKIIEQAFVGAKDYGSFYAQIGSSLPIRRAFRSWLSDKLFANDKNAKQLIDFTIKDGAIDSHWKDEVLVSVLLSDYSAVFFERFETELLEEPERVVTEGASSKVVRSVTVSFKYEDKLLHKILFLLRIACKTIDEDFLSLLGVTKAGAISLKTVFTKPKGSGWDSVIVFINKHKEKLQFRYMNAVLHVLDDWNRSRKSGETTKHASQIALYYYQKLTEQEGFYFSSRDDTKDKLIRTILNGSGEIKAELTEIVNEIIATDDTSHRGRYYEIAKAILSSVSDSSEIAKQIPKQVIKLANLFWFYKPKERNGYPFSDYRNDIEQYFDLTEGHLEYYPASAFQTPIFPLLQTDPQKTVDFILAFTNKSIEYFAKSEFAQCEAEETDVVIDDSGQTVNQYVCHRIWNLYRGTQVAPPLLESIHMALERWLLWFVKSGSKEVAESWCLYLLKNSRSTSITAIIVSAVLAEPSKLFNITQVLFRTKDLFLFDTARMQLDMTAKSTYAISHDPTGLFRNERIATCDDKHRSGSLEHLAFHYQMFASEEEGEEIAKQRQEIIWKIFDDYYKKLPDKSKETEGDKTWRLYLARMDRRKMKITTEKKDNQVLISFNPEIDLELKKYSEDALARNSESMKYLPLQLWVRNRLEKNEDYKKYPKYEDNYKLVICETKNVIKGLEIDESDEKSFTLFYRSVPAYVGAVLIRDFADKLDSEEKKFCKEIIIKSASTPIGDAYHYQIGDGVGVAIGALPRLLKDFPEDSHEVKRILLFTLFDSYPIGMSQKLSDYSSGAILNTLWKESPADAEALLFGYLQIKPLYDEMWESFRKESHEKGTYNFSKKELLDQFSKRYKTEITKILENRNKYGDIKSIDQIDTDTLVIAFELLPAEIPEKSHKTFVKQILPVLSKKLFRDRYGRDEDERFDSGGKHRFLDKLACIILYLKVEEIEFYLKPILDDFKDSKDAAEFFESFISVEDRLAQYEQFWTVWKLFYPKVVALAQGKGSKFYSKEVIRTYLLAWNFWREGVTEWHTLKDREKSFFKKASEDMGANPSTLYSLAKFLTDIGSSFKDEGIFWISDMLKNNHDLFDQELEVNTVYYLENLVRGYVLKNRHKIKTTLNIKTKVLVILDFLLSKGSVTAYMLREDIL